MTAPDLVAALLPVIEALDKALGESPDAPKAMVGSPEDTLLAKLEWCRRGGESSERQWSDILEGERGSALAGE